MATATATMTISEILARVRITDEADLLNLEDAIAAMSDEELDEAIDAVASDKEIDRTIGRVLASELKSRSYDLPEPGENSGVYRFSRA